MTAPLQGAAAAMHQKALTELEKTIASITLDSDGAWLVAEVVLELLQSDHSVTGDLIRVGAYVAAADAVDEEGPVIPRESVRQWLLQNADVLIGRNLTPDDL